EQTETRALTAPAAPTPKSVLFPTPRNPFPAYICPISPFSSRKTPPPGGTMVNDEISVLELSEILEKDPTTVLLDVREQEEFDEVNLSGTLIPLSEFEQRWQEVPKDKPVYVYCRSGRRSRTALEFLKKQ